MCYKHKYRKTGHLFSQSFHGGKICKYTTKIFCHQSCGKGKLGAMNTCKRQLIYPEEGCKGWRHDLLFLPFPSSVSCPERCYISIAAKNVTLFMTEQVFGK
jgi:hypothetical protein